jgi:hypothetical protein
VLDIDHGNPGLAAVTLCRECFEDGFINVWKAMK